MGRIGFGWMVWVTLAGCAGTLSGEAPVGLELTEESPSVLAGTYGDGVHVVSFRTLAESDDGGSLTLELGAHTLTMRVDMSEERIESDGGGAVLTASQRDTLSGLAAELVDRRPDAEPTTAEWLLERAASYWAVAPDGYVHAGRSRELSSPDLATRDGALVGNDGIDCEKRYGRAVRAHYDDQQGRHAEDVVVGACWGRHPRTRGDYDCMGRCGAGCGRWWAVSNWTQDCLEHDLCSFRHGSTDGAGDPDCGDEYDEAQDDWWWASFHGCGGSRNPLGC